MTCGRLLGLACVAEPCGSRGVIATKGVLAIDVRAIDVRESLLIKVRPRGNESIQQTLKRFKRLCQREGLIRDIKRHSYYEKPCERRRRQSRKLARTPV